MTKKEKQIIIGQMNSHYNSFRECCNVIEDRDSQSDKDFFTKLADSYWNQYLALKLILIELGIEV